MATTCYFEETVVDQNGKTSIAIEFGRASYYAGCQLDNGQTGTDSIYLTVGSKSVIMDRATTKRFVYAAISVGHHHGLID